MRIMLDPGHGGMDSGATYAGVEEADVVLSVARLAARKLSIAGHNVFMTRTERGLKKLRNFLRAGMANVRGADIYISLHCNAARNSAAEDTEVIYCPVSKKGKRLAQCMFDAFMATDSEFGDAGGRGIKTDAELGRGFRLTVLWATRMPAVIVEMAFMSNRDDRKFINDIKGQRLAAEAIVNGVAMYQAWLDVNHDFNITDDNKPF